MHGQWDFLLLATLAAAATTPALGQDADPAAQAASTAPQSTASAPDLSRLWANTLGPGLPQPASGPGPVRNKARQRQAVDIYGKDINPANAPVVGQVGRRVAIIPLPFCSPGRRKW